MVQLTACPLETEMSPVERIASAESTPWNPEDPLETENITAAWEILWIIYGFYAHIRILVQSHLHVLVSSFVVRFKPASVLQYSLANRPLRSHMDTTRERWRKQTFGIL